MSNQVPVVSLVVRLISEPVATGDLVGHAEVVPAGEVVPVFRADDPAQSVSRLAVDGSPR
jgi:hypothetical protein